VCRVNLVFVIPPDFSMTFRDYKGYTIGVFPINHGRFFIFKIEILDGAREVESFRRDALSGMKESEGVEYALRCGRARIDERIAAGDLAAK
jgi:hypothetical protein